MSKRNSDRSRLADHMADHLADHLATALMIFDKHTVLVWMNASAESLLTVSARQMVGSHAARLWPNAPELAVAIAEVCAGGQSMAMRDLTLEPRPGAETIRVDCAVTALPESASGSSVAIEMRLSDHDNALVRDAEHEARQRLAHRMVRNLAHELRNPLAGLRGAAQLLEHQLDDSGLKEYTGIIIGEADRLGMLISGLLGSEQVPRRQTVNVHQPLEHVRRLMAASESGQIRIDRDYDPSVPDVRVDPDQLIQALLNLMRNAVEAAAEQGGQITLRTRIMHNAIIGGQAQRLCARISVIDDGPGIPADQLERVFFPMVSGRPDHPGLGLAITRSLISANGGRIDCSSRPGRTEFMIDLPLADQASMAQAGSA